MQTMAASWTREGGKTVYVARNNAISQVPAGLISCCCFTDGFDRFFRGR